MDRVVITGGAGYVGLRLGAALAARGHCVLLLDFCPAPAGGLPPGVAFAVADVRDEAALAGHFRGAGLVFHVASFGMSGRTQLQHRLIEAINVQGTKNVIAACRAACVPRLVYTSTYNVVFGGEPIVCGDERLPYFPPHRHPDTYSRTKALAEQAVLGANGAPLLQSGSGCLHTCAVRPAGIYGPGEQRHLPRVVAALEAGLFRFVYGSPQALVDFVHVDNLVSAHVLAAEGLTAERGRVAAGQAYFISDDAPVNNFEFFRPLVEGLGHPMPTLRLPLRLVFCAAFLIELLHTLVWQLHNFQPLLTRCEVFKTGVTHYFSMAKARRELGYAPQQHSFDDVVHWFLERGHGRRGGRQRAVALPGSWRVLRAAAVAAAVAGLAALLLAVAPPLLQLWAPSAMNAGVQGQGAAAEL